MKYIKEINWKDALFAFITGIVIHGYRIFNFFPNWDSILSIKMRFTSMLNMGRWLAAPIKMLFTSPYDLQYVEGILTIAILAITCILIMEILGISKKKTRVITIILFMSFPAVASTFCYMNWSFSYALSYLFSILALFICIKSDNKLCIILACILNCLSMGIYQLYVTTAFVCFLYFIVVSVLRGKDDYKLKKIGFQYVFSLIIGAILYYIIMKIMLKINVLDLTNYQGISSINQLNVWDMLLGFKRAAKNILLFFFGSSHQVTVYGLINFLFIIFTIFLCYKFIFRSKKISSIKKIIIILCVLVGFCATYAFSFISSDTYYHMIMQTGMLFPYILLIILCENDDYMISKAASVPIILLCVLCFYHIINNNIAYKQLEISYERSTFKALNIIQKIDSISVNGKEKLVFIGDIARDDMVLIKTIPNITGASDDSFLNSVNHFQKFVYYYYGRQYAIDEYADIQAIKETEEYQNASRYPYGDYAFKYKDNIVIKFS